MSTNNAKASAASSGPPPPPLSDDLSSRLLEVAAQWEFDRKCERRAADEQIHSLSATASSARLTLAHQREEIARLSLQVAQLQRDAEDARAAAARELQAARLCWVATRHELRRRCDQLAVITDALRAASNATAPPNDVLEVLEDCTNVDFADGLSATLGALSATTSATSSSGNSSASSSGGALGGLGSDATGPDSIVIAAAAGDAAFIASALCPSPLPSRTGSGGVGSGGGGFNDFFSGGGSPQQQHAHAHVLSLRGTMTDALFQTCFHGHAPVLKYLLSLPQPHAPDLLARRDISPSFFAGRDGSASRTNAGNGGAGGGVSQSKLKLQGAGMTALHFAAASGNEETFRIVLAELQQAQQQAQSGSAPAAAANVISVDDGDAHLRTPLHVAVTAGTAGIVRILLVAGADPSIADLGGFTPLQLAEGAAASTVMSVSGAARGGSSLAQQQQQRATLPAPYGTGELPHVAPQPSCAAVMRNVSLLFWNHSMRASAAYASRCGILYCAMLIASLALCQQVRYTAVDEYVCVAFSHYTRQSR